MIVVRGATSAQVRIRPRQRSHDEVRRVVARLVGRHGATLTTADKITVPERKGAGR